MNQNKPIVVYRIDKFILNGNHHNLGRDEKWKIVKDSEFENLEDAEKYVEKMNKQFHTIDLSLHQLKDLNEIKHRCVYDDNFNHRKSFFINRPSISKIKEQLIKEGITVK